MEREGIILQKLDKIESLLNTLIYGNTPKITPVTSNKPFKYIYKPTLDNPEMAHKEVINFTKELYSCAVNQQDVDDIVAKYTNEKISLIPLDKLPSLVEDLVEVNLQNACVESLEIPF